MNPVWKQIVCADFAIQNKEEKRLSKKKNRRSPVYCISWITIPERSFGSNQVDFGGIIRPASATSITC